MLFVVGLLLLMFVLEMTVVGAVRHDRVQRVEYQVLRKDLALSTAPTGQLDDTGKALALGRPMALLEISSLGMREVVDEGTNGATLQNGPGHLRSSTFPGQAGTSVIMGRQAAYGGPFGQIASLKVGATIKVVTGQGSSEYAVTGIRHSGDKSETSTDPRTGTLTLITGSGTPYSPSGAVWVDAKLTSAPFASSGMAFGASALSKSENTMASDRSNGLKLFLWAQLLLLLSLLLAWVRANWAGPQTWIVAVPLLALGGLQVAHYAAQFLPNLV